MTRCYDEAVRHSLQPTSLIAEGKGRKCNAWQAALTLAGRLKHLSNGHTIIMGGAKLASASSLTSAEGHIDSSGVLCEVFCVMQYKRCMQTGVQHRLLLNTQLDWVAALSTRCVSQRS